MKSVGIAIALLLAILATVEAKPAKATPATTFNDIVIEPPDTTFCYVYGQCQVVSSHS